MSTKKKFKIFKTEQQKENFKAGLAIGGAALVVFGYGCLCGYCIGFASSDKQTAKCLGMCFEKDPTLKQHLVDTILKVQGDLLMKGEGL